MKTKRRMRISSGILVVFFVIIFLVVTGRFLYIQVSGEVNGISLREWAEEKRTASYTLDAERGKILDKNGETLAYDRPAFRLYAILDETYSEHTNEINHVENPGRTAEKLAPILDMEPEEILSIMERGIQEGKTQVEFGPNGKGLSQKTKETIEALNLPGIHFMKEPIRYYPNGMFASHIIGFAQNKDDEIEGVAGIEHEMDNLLKGKHGHISYERDKYGVKLLDPNEIIQTPKDGADIYLTIDQKIQTLVEDSLTEIEKTYNPKRMSAIVMDPKTGEIVAMSNRPSYNPNAPADVQNWYNDAISTPFEPGSTMKIFTWAAAIEEEVYNGQEAFQSGTYRISDRIQPINDHNSGKGWGEISFDEGFARSSNVAAAKLVWEKLKPETFLDYLHAFDLDEKTGIDLPGEVPGHILYNWPAEKLTTAFGQGSTLTPIQQIKAATAIANGGKMLQPYVISKVVDPESGEIIKEKSPQVAGEPISEATAKQMRDLLESVVSEEYGTGERFNLDDYTVIGKTGTAQIPNSDGSGYLPGRENNIFSFLGMAPKDDPQLMVYVSIKQPELDDEPGSVPVSFIFKNVMRNSLHYLNIKPDKETNDAIEAIDLPDVTGEKTKEAEHRLSELGLDTVVIGKGEKVKALSTEAKEQVFPGERIIILTDQPTMPDISGWSMRDVLKLADVLELELETAGNGYVTAQSIDKGKSVKKGDTLRVELEPPSEIDALADEEKQSAD